MEFSSFGCRIKFYIKLLVALLVRGNQRLLYKYYYSLVTIFESY